jgi:hypothetical protein
MGQKFPGGFIMSLTKVAYFVFFTATFTLSISNAEISPLEKSAHLGCQLRDETRLQILDQRSVPYVDGKNILMLMGTSELTATVRDLPGKTRDDRHIELEMRYQSGTEWGNVHASTDYKISDANKDLASVSLTEPTWQHEISLSCSTLN